MNIDDWIFVLSAIIAGLLLAVALISWLERRRRKPKDRPLSLFADDPSPEDEGEPIEPRRVTLDENGAATVTFGAPTVRPPLKHYRCFDFFADGEYERVCAGDYAVLSRRMR